VGQGEDPGQRAAPGGVEPRGGPPQFEQHLLGHLLGLGGVAHHAPHQSEHRPGHQPVQVLECLLVASRHAHQKLVRLQQPPPSPGPRRATLPHEAFAASAPPDGNYGSPGRKRGSGGEKSYGRSGRTASARAGLVETRPIRCRRRSQFRCVRGKSARRTDGMTPISSTAAGRRGLATLICGALAAGGLAAAGATTLQPRPAGASSHREAPLISGTPQYDNTDLYAFVSPDKPDTTTFIANWIPFEEPAGGPNFFTFAEDAQYDIHIDNNGDAQGELLFRYTFTTHTKNDKAVLYTTGPVTGLDDQDLNRTQTYG